MIRYNQFSKNRFFLAPEGAGGGGGGSVGNPGANQGGASEGQGESSIDPFAGIDLDDLDPGTRKVMEAAKNSFATLQKQASDEKKAREHTEKLSREFQGKYDQLVAQSSRQGQQQAEDPQVVLLNKFTATLVAKGVTPEQAKIQAPLMLEMMQTYGESLKSEIGRDMAPFAGSVLQTEAHTAWQGALQHDKFGALNVQEVADQTWAQVQTLVQQGQSVSAATIKNISSMFFMEHLEKTGGQLPTPMTQPPPQLPNIGALRTPGGLAFRPPQVDPNAARTTLDPATNAALQSVMSKWDVKPKSFTGGRR